MSSNAVYFYGAAKKNGFLSNFFPAKIKIDGEWYDTTEHYFQAMKTKDPKRRERIRRAATPGKAAKMGRARKATKLRPDWEDVKDEAMLTACLAKFTQHPDLWKQLDETGDSILVEHTKRDRYWGDAGDGSGTNMLGKILWLVRKTTREKLAASSRSRSV
jgi:ribA/ribD-fused uncharacterized protein